MISPVILFFKSHVSGYTRRDGTYVKPHEDKRHKDPALDPERIAGMAAGRRRLDEHDEKMRAADAPRREARLQQIINAAQPEWETLEGVDILRIPGSDFAALPVTGKRNAANFQAFNVKTREPLTQLKKGEVAAWLRKMSAPD